MKRNAFAREEEFRRFPCRNIEFVESPDWYVIPSNRDIREAFRVHFRNRFTRLPGKTGVSQLFSRLQEAEAAWLRGVCYGV